MIFVHLINKVGKEDLAKRHPRNLMMQETMEPKMSAEYVAKCNQLKGLKLGNTECIKWVSYSQVRQALYPQDAHANAFWRATLSVFLLLQVIFAS